MNRKPIFEVPFFDRTYMDTQNHILPTINGNPEFRRGEKGFGLAGFAAGDGLAYTKTIPNGTYSVVMWVRSHEGNQILVDWRNAVGAGIGYLYITNILDYAVSSGTIYVNNVATVASKQEIFECVVVSGITLDSTLININVRYNLVQALENGNIPYFAIYENGFTAAERDELYQDFLSAPGPTSTPNIIRHLIPVDPTGSILCHNYQSSGWRGGIVPDLSGNGNDGIPNGFVDCGIDGAVFHGADYINVDGTGDADPTQLTIEALFKVSVGGSGCIYAHRSETIRLLQFRAENDSQLKFQMRGSGAHLEEIIYSVDVTNWVYGVAIFDKVNNLHKLYVNGVDRGTDTTDFGIENFVATKQTIGGIYFTFYTSLLNGSIKFVKAHNSILTEAKIQSNWNKYANQAIFNEPMFNQLPDNRSYTAGMYLENWYVSSGTFTVEEDSTGTYIECTGNGIIQYKGIDFSMYKENGFIKKIVGDISSDQDKTVDTAVNIAFASNTLSVTLTTGQKLYELVITKGEKV